ncbi:MAG: class I SAM-dependent methyltransferase [Nitrospirota bacterium]|nr:class I SAM-dependent methyltransferase [Nitrospirota bacterium]
MAKVDARLGKDATYLKSIRNQYENLPYPPRDPEDETRRLIRPTSERLAELNHHCYRGKRRFDDFRVLVAGGGTGDGTTYLAMQLSRYPGARIVHLDLSTASIDIARRRVEKRGLTNVEFVHGSILDLPAMGFAPFDYINCTGVLMVMEDPDAGLRAIRSVLKPDGAMGIMLYATYGRTGLYQIQELLRRIHPDGSGADIPQKLETARQLLEELPGGNWFKRGEDLFNDHRTMGDSGIYDMFLISHDRAYTVPEVYAFAAGAGLHVLDYAWARERIMLEPEQYIQDPVLRERIHGFDTPRRRAIAELLSGALTRQHVYMAPEPDRRAPLEPDYVPTLMDVPDPATHHLLADHIRSAPDVPFAINAAVASFSVMPGRYTAEIFARMDGETSFGQMFADIRASGMQVTDDELLEDFRPVYDKLAMADAVLLHHTSVPATVEVVHGDHPGVSAG